MDSIVVAAGSAANPDGVSAPHREALVAAIDIGGTGIKAALFVGTGEPLYTFRVPTPRREGPDAVVRAVLATAEHLLDQAQRRYEIRPEAVGVACLGLVDEQQGTAVYSAAVGWQDLPLVDLLRSRLHLPVALIQDIRAAAYAETAAGDPSQSDPTLFVAIGTGIGGALTVGGHLLPGAQHRAAEIGHLQVRPQGRRCGCGGRGCLETYSSATAIAATASQALGREVTTSEVAQAATQGHGWAVRIWQEAIALLAQALTAAALIVDPVRIVIGGGLSLAGPALLLPLRRAVADLYQLGTPPAIVPTRFGDIGALYGAALSACDLLAATVGAR